MVGTNFQTLVTENDRISSTVSQYNQVSVTNIVVQICTDFTDMVIDQKSTGQPHLY